MGIVSIRKTFKGRSASGAMDERSYAEMYDVIVQDMKSDTPEDARRAKIVDIVAPGPTAQDVDIPNIGDPLVFNGTRDTDFNRVVTTVAATQDESQPLLYRVEVQYGSAGTETRLNDPNDPGKAQPEGGGDPFKEIVKISVGFEARREQVTKARVMTVKDPGGDPELDEYEVQPIESLAGEPFDPPPEVDLYDTVVVYVRNEEENVTDPYNPTRFSVDKCRAYNGKTNEVLWGTVQPGEARCEITSERLHQGGFQYWQVIYRFAIRTQVHPIELPLVPLNVLVGWDLVLINQGTRQIVDVDQPAGKTLVPIYEDDVAWAPQNVGELAAQATENRVPVSTPMKLDNTGKVIVPNSTTGNIGPTTYVPTTRSATIPLQSGVPSSYEIYDRIDFNLLLLPAPPG